MSEVELRTVAAAEAELRLDRWFRRHFPALTHGRLQKLLRTGQVRVDGRRAQAHARLAAGQTIRVPPLAAAPEPPQPQPLADPRDAAFLRRLILVEDRSVLVLNKPEGLAVQGGTGTRRHIDGMLAALAVNGERPRLVHRLDRDTSGVLVVAKTADAAAKLTRAFRQH
ncbi:MAG TPA: pseudouridine synthase, partial [Geminicoccaceae bacterium]|nr:pseudouridine synthase [Geminicoccaceae bacterium]